MYDLGSVGWTRAIDDRLRGHAKADQLLADALESRLELVPVVADLGERSLEDLHPPAPVVALLNAEERRVYVDHARRTGVPKNQGFARAENPSRGAGSADV
jgi:hypothetical protein